MFKKITTYTNQLTELIKANPNIKVEDVFSHEQLSITIRNEAPGFLEYIFPQAEMDKDNPILPIYEQILDYALTNKTHKFKDDSPKHPNLSIINQNAASFLSSPSKKLEEFVNKDKEKRLFKRLRHFIEDKQSSLNPTVAGNFSRIFMAWFTKSSKEFGSSKLLQDFYDDNFSINKLIIFFVDNIQELAYSEILERLLTVGFDDNIGDPKIIVFYTILQRIRDIIGAKIEVGELDDGESSFTLMMNQKYHYLKEISQSPTYKNERIPIPEYIKNYPEDTPPILISEKSLKLDKSPYIPIVEELKDSDIRKSDLLAYTLINVIWSAGNESPSIFEFIQKQQPKGKYKNKKRILEYLFFIGVFGYSNVMLCSMAFRILNIVVNGDNKMDIRRISKEERRNQLGNDIVSWYAEFVVYDINNLSNLAVLSFPVFYNHRYKNLTCGEDSQIIYGIKNIVSRYSADKKYGKPIKYITNTKGLTPFLYLTPVAFTEPPLSSELSSSYTNILSSLYIERIDLIGKLTDKLTDEQELNEIIERMKKLDEFYLDFTSYKFEYPGFPGKCTIYELIENLFPLNPRIYTTDKSELANRYGDKVTETIRDFSINSRPILNHAFAKVASLIAERDVFLTTKDAKLISSKSPNPIPYFKKPEDRKYKDENSADDYILFNLKDEYNSILKKSQENKLEAGEFDPNAKLDAS